MISAFESDNNNNNYDQEVNGESMRRTTYLEYGAHFRHVDAFGLEQFGEHVATL